MNDPSPTARFWAGHRGVDRPRDDAHLQSHHPPDPDPPPNEAPEEDGRIAERLRTFVQEYRAPDFSAVAQHRLDHIAAQRAQPPMYHDLDPFQSPSARDWPDHIGGGCAPMYHDLDPEAFRAFREHLARTGARETCMACDVDHWAAHWFIGRRTCITKTCLRCGFMTSFDAAVVGVLPPEPEPPPRAAASVQVVADGRILQSTVRTDLNKRIGSLLEELRQHGYIS